MGHIFGSDAPFMDDLLSKPQGVFHRWPTVKAVGRFSLERSGVTMYPLIDNANLFTVYLYSASPGAGIFVHGIFIFRITGSGNICISIIHDLSKLQPTCCLPSSSYNATFFVWTTRMYKVIFPIARFQKPGHNIYWTGFF